MDTRINSGYDGFGYFLPFFRKYSSLPDLIRQSISTHAPMFLVYLPTAIFCRDS